jgi:hypothetical protein
MKKAADDILEGAYSPFTAVGFGQHVRHLQSGQRTQAYALTDAMQRTMLNRQLCYAHPRSLSQQNRNVVHSIRSFGKCIGHADNLTPVSKPVENRRIQRGYVTVTLTDMKLSQSKAYVNPFDVVTW